MPPSLVPACITNVAVDWCTLVGVYLLSLGSCSRHGGTVCRDRRVELTVFSCCLAPPTSSADFTKISPFVHRR